MKTNSFKIICFALLFFCFTQNFKCDPCRGSACGDNGVCLDGYCECSAGYEGENCELQRITKYLGHWVGTEIQNTQDTLAVDWRITQAADMPINGKIQTANNSVININFIANNDTLKMQAGTVLDAAHTIDKGALQRFYAPNKDTLNYNIYYKAFGANPGFNGKGKLVRVP
jgi:hypothetical protein